jgi:beta-lactamase regulating signal transducer with metallopeptidase domain
VRFAAAAAALPGAAFLAIATSVIHVRRPWIAGSRGCLLHCSAVELLVAAVCAYAAVRCAYHACGAAKLGRLANEPGERLRRMASALDMTVRQLPTQSLVLATTGAWRPRVLVSDGVLDRLSDDELCAALLHERAHIRRCEPLRSAVIALAGDCTPAPVARAFDAYCRAREHVADREAVRDADPLVLASALLALSRSKPVGVHAAPFARRSTIRCRVEALLGVESRDRATHRVTAAALLAMAGLVVCLPAFVKAMRVCGP